MNANFERPCCGPDPAAHVACRAWLHSADLGLRPSSLGDPLLGIYTSIPSRMSKACALLWPACCPPPAERCRRRGDIISAAGWVWGRKLRGTRMALTWGGPVALGCISSREAEWHSFLCVSHGEARVGLTLRGSVAHFSVRQGLGLKPSALQPKGWRLSIRVNTGLSVEDHPPEHRKTCPSGRIVSEQVYPMCYAPGATGTTAPITMPPLFLCSLSDPPALHTDSLTPPHSERRLDALSPALSLTQTHSLALAPTGASTNDAAKARESRLHLGMG